MLKSKLPRKRFRIFGRCRGGKNCIELAFHHEAEQ